jgi:uncharacterized protein (TIGR02246 family)
MRRLAVAVVLAIVPAPLAHAQSLSEEAKTRVRSEVQAAVDALAASARAADLEGCLASLSTSSGSRFADGETVYESLAAQRAAYRDAFARMRSQDLLIDGQDILVLSPELAAYTGRGSFTSTCKTGETTPRRAFAWTFLWSRENGRWKIIHGHQSLEAPSEAVPVGSQELPQPQKHEKARWFRIVRTKYKYGKTWEARQIIREHLVRATETSGAAAPVMEFHHQTGPWDETVIWAMPEGAAEMEWALHPEFTKWFASLAKLEGGADKAWALLGRYSDLVEKEETELALQRPFTVK